MRFHGFLAALAVAGLLAGGAPIASAQSSAVPLSVQDYKLGVSDKVRIVVYNEPTLSGEFPVNANGAIAFPLIGDVPASGQTATQLARQIEAKLADGLLRDPKVSIDVASFRPFYILGEVNKPGEYPYSVGLSVLNAVATAQGFTYRADKRRVYIKSAGENGETVQRLDSATPVKPGDTIRIGERFF
jgi:polysaccharide export outer membrane protein